jgi:ribose transport system permease protein
LIKGIVIILAVAIDGLKQHPELFTFWRKKRSPVPASFP